ncbi:nuclease-related domain-containing protein [Pseudalkalibacillus berkeleyi]|uniref:NERD domain-containing protein n=1 Tax=Pseudalkalibacillus berkeleyi TaxID=1069813 RepID=A0ABS9H138_9BACL|nr:nuclease-related domain-containing protein [Pseudalkalibacillus berkeleyi]MCF6138718.1 NERD domain-containing protein [Pseudalkalibacillus berkeleyi]
MIEIDLAKHKTGYRGELTLGYYLAYLPPKETSIFNGLRLFDTLHFFQMDTVILTPTFILIVEVKNISGRVKFDDVKQMIRTLDGKEEGFLNPFLQVEWQKEKLKRWLDQHKFPEIPIKHHIVISNPSTIIEPSAHIPTNLTPAANIYFAIEDLKNAHPIEVMKKEQIRKLSRLFIKKHTPYVPDVMEKYKLIKEDLRTGIYCPACKQLAIKRKQGRWVCSECEIDRENAHIEVLKEYKLLLGPTISAAEFQWFAGLPSQLMARRILQSMDLQVIGKNKGTRYVLPNWDDR